MDSNIAFIGAGNMASSLVMGLLGKGVRPECIIASDVDADRLATMTSECGIRTLPSAQAAGQADVLVMAVKPQVMATVCSEIAPHISKPDCVVVSVAAGVPLASLQSWFGEQRAIVRTMPNTPALVGEGATALYASNTTSDRQKQLAADIMAAVGSTCWLTRESDIDIVTALSGSGPAYYFLLMEAMEKAAVSMGLDADIARRFAIQTAKGAGQLAADQAMAEPPVAPDELRRRVTSPGGTTEQAINSFERDGFADIVERAMQAARLRSAELGAAARSPDKNTATNKESNS